jgi:hypothetical protein
MGASDFLLSTLSNLIATVIGVLIGLPVALYVTELGGAKERAARDREIRSRAVASLGLLREAISYNTSIFDRSIEKMLDGEVVHFLDLRLSALAVAMPNLIEARVDADLLQILSHHWQRLAFYNEFNSQMFAREFGEEDWREERQRETMWGGFADLTGTLRHHCSELLTRIDVAEGQLAGNR